MSNQQQDRFRDVFTALAAPFAEGEVKERPAPGGRRTLSYITARTAMNRLDDVVGPQNWWDRYEVGRDNSVICYLTLRLVADDGEVVELTKCDVGVRSDSVGEDAEKGGFSDAFKRAAAKFGLARYLYRDGVAEALGGGRAAAPAAQAPRQDRDAPRGGGNGYQGGGRTAGPRPGGSGRGGYGVPRDGRSLTAALFGAEEQHGLKKFELFNYLEGWSEPILGRKTKVRDLPANLIADAYAAAMAYVSGGDEPGVDDPDRPGEEYAGNGSVDHGPAPWEGDGGGF